MPGGPLITVIFENSADFAASTCSLLVTSGKQRSRKVDSKILRLLLLDDSPTSYSFKKSPATDLPVKGAFPLAIASKS